MKKKETVRKEAGKKKGKVATYVGESLGELKKVSWPRKEEVVNSTIVVITLIIIISLILSVFDIGVSKAVEYLFEPVASFILFWL